MAKSERYQKGITLRDRVGGKVAPPVPPHHRVYGAVHGGSRGPLQVPPLIEPTQEAPLRQDPMIDGGMPMGGPSIPPGPTAWCRGRPRTLHL
jgi:hypothetical protein